MTSRLIVNSIRHTGASADAITLDNSGNATFPANVTCSGTASGFASRFQRNLIINGAMQVAQRSTSSTTNGYGSVDRYSIGNYGVDEVPTHAQVDVASGTTPYTNGFRKALKITNGNQTSGAGAADYIEIGYKIESQDIANSGWNYLSSSSFITLSYWVKSSVAQTFYGYMFNRDGTIRSYPWSTGSLNADTWTKITKTIPGFSGLQFDNDNGAGLEIYFPLFNGTNMTNNSRSLNNWATHDGAAQTPDQTSTWYTTNDATFEMTGLQLEVSDSASDFEHRSFGQELNLCKRYYQEAGILLSNTSPYRYHNNICLETEMRITPTRTVGAIDSGSGGAITPLWDNTNGANSKQYFYQGNPNSVISNAWFKFDAEL